MSLLNPTPEQMEPAPKAPPKRHISVRVLRGIAWAAIGLVSFVAVLVLGLSWYTTTSDFQHRVGKEVVGILEDATGGRVELKQISFNLWHLAIEADGLVIHGLEGPGEAPYLSADRILVRVKIVSFLQHTTGGEASHIGLNLLRVEQPRVHLIIDKDGKTNQPVPKHKAQGNSSTLDTLLDLKAHEVELANGVALLNDKAIPFNLAARDLQAKVQYVGATDRYAATIDLNDLRTQMLKQPEAQSQLHVEAEVGRDMAALKNLTLKTGPASNFQASGSIDHFANPNWQAKLDGSIALRQLTILTGVEGFTGGSVELDVNGHNCNTTPAVAQRHPKFWDRLHHPSTPSSAKVLPPDPDCPAGYLLVGAAKIHNAGFETPYVRVFDVNGGANLHITPTELLFTSLTAILGEGGTIRGQMKIVNWLGEAPANSTPQSATLSGAIDTANKTSAVISSKGAPITAPKTPSVVPAQTFITVTVDRVPLRTIMHIVAVKGYGDLGYDTAITGPVEVDWGGPASEAKSAVQVDADLQLHPVGDHRGRSNVPIDGHLLAHYNDANQTVTVKQLNLATPQSTLVAGGVLGVGNGGPLTALQTDLTIHDLGEFDQVLTTLDLEGNGRKGAAAIPAVLHGTAHFYGTATGAITRIDVKGHLEANNVEVLVQQPPAPAPAASKKTLLGALMNPGPTAPPPLPPPVLDVQVDSLVADADYTPQGLSVASSTVRRKSAVLNLSGSFTPRTIAHGKTLDYDWDDQTTVNLKVQLANADMTDLLQIAGQQQKFPITGTIALNANAAGELRNLTGVGTLSLLNGAAYGEAFDSLQVAAKVSGKQFDASSIALRLHGMEIDGNGGYNLASKQMHAHIQGNNLLLSKFDTIQHDGLNADGTVSLLADANGTLAEPGLNAHIGLENVTLQGKPVGNATLDAHSQGKVVFYTAKSTLVGSEVNANGQTELDGDYQSKAQVSIAKLDIGVALGLFEPGIKATSDISGTVTIAGPARTPRALTGGAAFDHFSFSSQGITLQAAQPLRIGLKNGVATLDQVHITGPDTDLRANGNAEIFGALNSKTGQPDPNGGKVNIQTVGSISVALAHTFDPEITSSGKVVFSVGVGGQVKNPALSGKVDFQNVNLALDSIPNGLSNMNGTLVFNEDRLNVESLTATTGGGQVKIGGFLSFRGGLYADLSANANVVRIRYNGISGTANANLRLQGSGQTALLSGSVLLTRFGIGQDVDFAAFASAGGVSAPPDPNSLVNKIRMNVKVTSSPQLDFQNSYAKLAGTVDLNLGGTIAEPSVLGRIQITDGSATFANTKYELQRGDIYFSNPVRIDPNIDLDATARVENYDITVGLQGTASNLKPTYRSSPPLSEADIFNLLALGRTQEEAQIYQEQQEQSGTDPTTNALLGGALNATVSNRVSKLFGGGSVKIDPAFVGTLGTSSARITVQQQLSRQLTLTYATNVGYSSEQLISVQYDLTPNVSIVATRDESDVFSIVYKIRRRYR